ncbi:MAG TPA: MFS transporter [Spirochaetes bacterium]|nr:MFS transporter [Spirochaetota bacterium]
MSDNNAVLETVPVGRSAAMFTLTVTTMLYIINYMDRMVLSATLPLIKQDLGLTDAQCGWLGTIYFIVVAVLTIPASILCDRWSRKKSLSLMALLWSAATFLSGAGSRFCHLFAARGGVGVGEAGFAPGGIAFVSGSFRESERSKVIGVFNLGQPLGSILGVVLAGMIARSDFLGLGWRGPFYLFAIPGLLLGVLVLFAHDYPTESITYAGDRRLTVIQGLVKVFRTPTLILTYLGVGAMSFVGGAVAHWLPTYFVRSRGIDVGSASLLMGGIIAFAVIGPIAGGIAADRWKKTRKNARPLAASLIALACGLFLYAGFMTDTAGYHDVSYGVFILVGILMFGYSAPAYSVSQDLVPRGMRSLSMGILVLITYGTLAAYAPVVVGLLSDLLGAGGVPNLTAAFMFVPPVGFLGAGLFYLASRFHDRDMKKLTEEK